MAVTGLIMIGFLLMHMYGNTKIFYGAAAFDKYSHYLREFLYPILPKELFLNLFRAFMLATILLHIYSAFSLWSRNRRNVSGKRYEKSGFLGGGNYVSFLMRWGGVTVLLFVIFHILQFTTETVKVGYDKSIEPAQRMILAFNAQHWYIFVIYIVVMVFVCFHVAHGLWSAFATLGANVSKGAEKVLNIIAGLVAVLLFVGFMAAPVAILIGVIK